MDVALWKCKIDKYKKKFSTNDTWGHIREAHPSCISWSNGVWSQYVTPRYSLLWLALKNRLATCDRITKWTQTSIPCVCLMQMAMGIVEHLFFTCSYSAFMWEKLTKGMLAEKYTTNWICITHLVQPKDMPDGPDHALFMPRTSLCDLERKE